MSEQTDGITVGPVTQGTRTITQRFTVPVDTTQDDIAALQQQVADLTARLETQREVLAVLGDPDSSADARAAAMARVIDQPGDGTGQVSNGGGAIGPRPA